MAAVTLSGIEKTYPNGFNAVRGVDLEVRDGEFIVLVGPSGCAKSTLLRMIAGLESITGGELRIGSRRVNELPAKERGIAMVFQNYALYPHMKVYDNLAFGLRLAGTPKGEVDRRVRHAAEWLEMEHLLDRYPRQLSGGQAQRVAVGRAIVKEPDVFLFDEPLSNLDAKLRAAMRVRLIELHRTLREKGRSATVIYVTHDQTEAMTMGERICLLREGVIQQVDTPVALYRNPANAFVAGFIGSPEMNLMPAMLVTEGGHCGLRIGGEAGATLAWQPSEAMTKLASGATVTLGLRPEHISLMRGPSNDWVAQAVTLRFAENMGNEIYLHVNIGAQMLTARVPVDDGRILDTLVRGSTLTVYLNLAAAHFFDGASGRRFA
jgi:oligogalacturonide transport system ATP-binding protein